MKVLKTDFQDLFIIEPEKHNDSRGFFVELFRLDILQKVVSYDIKFCQDNFVNSKKNVLRGLHYQENPYAQSKLVYVSSGKILDIAVDLRKKSSTYGKVFSAHISSNNKIAVFIPKGFAHGYVSLCDSTCVHYKVDNYYKKSAEKGVKYDDPFLNIDWQLSKDEMIISKKDLSLSNYRW